MVIERIRRRSQQRRWAAFWVACALAAAALVWLYLRPGGAEMGMPCLIHWATGLYCPGCGFTRALHLLLHGHPYAAFRMNPLGVALLPVLVYLSGAQVVQWLTGRRALPRIPNAAVYALIALVLLYAIARNIPAMPFAWLRPTAV